MSVVGLVILLVLCAFPFVQLEVFDSAFQTDLNTFIKKSMDCRHVPGLTISVIKGSDTWAQGYGTSDLSKGLMVDNSTMFNIGSVTKSFTMTLLGILLTEKGMDWTAKVVDILGANYGFIDEYRTREMTLRDLLSHRTGLPGLTFGFIAGYPDSLSRGTLCMNQKYIPEAIPFRDSFIYNNYMYMMLGHVTEKLGGDTWENLVTSKVLKPIGMTSTRILKEPSNVLEDGVARPYIFKDNIFQNGTLDLYNIHPLEPAGAILSNGEDMAKYMRFNLKYGETEDGTRLLDLVLMTKAFTATTSLPAGHVLYAPYVPVSETNLGYGHAWITSTYNGYRRYWHSGNLFAYTTLLWLFPDINAGVYASINGAALHTDPSYALSTIFYYISDKLIGQQPWLNETTTCEFPDPWRSPTQTNRTPTEQSVKLANPSEYVGYYENKFMPGINVTETPGDKSSLSFQMNRLTGILHSTPDTDRFLLEVESPLEIAASLLDSNNETIQINSTFHRNDVGEIRSWEFTHEVKVEYFKDGNFPDGVAINSAMVLVIANPVCLFIISMTSLITFAT